MQLSSGAFSGGSAIPRRSTCNGEDRSPTVEWEVEREARKYVIAEATLIGTYRR